MRTSMHENAGVDPFVSAGPCDFPIGDDVQFDYDGNTYIGTVVRHNKKTFSVMVDGLRWRLPWVWAAQHAICL